MAKVMDSDVFIEDEIDEEGGWPMTFDSGAMPVGSNFAGHDASKSGPKVLVLNAYLADLIQIDTLNQTFKAKLQITLDWVDDGVLTKPSDFIDNIESRSSTTSYWSADYYLKEPFEEDPGKTTFNPKFALVNAVEDADPIEAASAQDVYMLRGRPVISQYMEFLTTFRSTFNLHNFPFDESELVMTFTSSMWSSNDIEIRWSKIMDQGLAAIDPVAVGGHGVSEFEIIGIKTESSTKEYAYLARYDSMTSTYPDIKLTICVRRDPFSYLMRVATVSVMLLLMETLSFLMEPSDIGGRFGISGTTFLSLVAFFMVTVDTLPRTGAITRCDKWNLANFFLMFASNVENLIAFALVHGGHVDEEELAHAGRIFAAIYVVSVFLALLWFIMPLFTQAPAQSMAQNMSASTSKQVSAKPASMKKEE